MTAMQAEICTKAKFGESLRGHIFFWRRHFSISSADVANILYSEAVWQVMCVENASTTTPQDAQEGACSRS